MRHTYECSIRWADMDQLAHINNVAYLDYIQEARIALFAGHPGLHDAASGTGLVVVRHELEFVTPMEFRKRPVHIDTWITEVRAGSFTMAYEIYDPATADREKVVYLRASSRLAAMVLDTGEPRRISTEEKAVLELYLEQGQPRTPLVSDGSSQHVYPVQVRWSDLDPYQHVNNAKFVEYFQEARISYSMAMYQPGDVFGEFVVARVDIDYKRPVLYRAEAYEVHSWISRVGTTSAVWCSEVRDPSTGSGAGEVLATTQVVTVGFDTATQRSAALPPDHRGRLLEQLHASGPGER